MDGVMARQIDPEVDVMDAHRERFDEHKQPIGNSSYHGEICYRRALVTVSIDKDIKVIKPGQSIIEHGRLHPIG